MELLKNKQEEYLKFYIDSNANIDSINKFIRKENISLNEFNDIVTNYLKELKSQSKNKKNINKLYLEYCLKYGNVYLDTKKVSKRKTTETIINIINNYIKEDKHNIKEYVSSCDFSYTDFKKFINNSKNYYLKDIEKDILKNFLKRENKFNKDNIEKVKVVVDRISDDLVNDKPFGILEYYKELGWDSKLLIYYLNNNKDIFSNFIIDNVSIYIKKYHINDKKYKLNEFINYIKSKNKDMVKSDIENIINYMNENKMPYNYYLFDAIKLENLNKSE